MIKNNYRNLLALLAILILPILSYSQEGSNHLPFVTIEGKEDPNTYYLLDLNQLPGFLEKAYLLDLLFKDHSVVVMNSSISGRTLKIASNAKIETAAVIKQIEDYRLQALKAGQVMSESEKTDLLNKYEKYR